MNDLFSALRLSDFAPLLQAYRAAGIGILAMIDGGAAAGAATRKLLKCADPGAVCYAFEPFPGNHRFLENLGPHVVVRKEALAEKSKVSTFQVSSVVSADSAWGHKGLEGYSSVGFLTEKPQSGNRLTLEVSCVRADAVVDPATPVDFVKLDLQGGELNALRGMTGFLDQPLAMWVEYSGQAGLAEFLVDAGYLLFDTEYFGLGDPGEDIRRQFNVVREKVVLSTGKEAWFGFKRGPWANYPEEFAELRRRKILVQTDIVCINRRKLKEFCAMLGHLHEFLK